VLLNPPIGKGAYGEVRKGLHRVTEVIRAIKIISKNHTSAEDHEKLKQEVEILRKLDHPNIIKVYEFYQDSRFFYIVTELCTGGELFDKISQEKHFSE
jgi:calcium-dependent protein kinase